MNGHFYRKQADLFPITEKDLPEVKKLLVCNRNKKIFYRV